MRRRFILQVAATLAVAMAHAVPVAAAGEDDERWLSEIALDELSRCKGGREWERLGKELEAAILARLACGRRERLAALTDMVYAARACVYLPLAARGKGGEDFARWLLAHREVTRRLFRALEEGGSPAESLARLARLRAAEPQRVVAYPGLTVALATAQPLQHYRRQANPADLLASFRYYTDPGRRFRHDLKTMPYELAHYLADTRADVEDRQWATRRYRNRTPATAYFDVEYDMPHFTTGRAKRIDSVPYTLANIAKIGGVCLDQAYYASEVCKAMGIPAAIVHGRGGAGVRHAWFAYCTVTGSPRGLRATWTSRTGRYEGNLYFVGRVRNPVNGKMIPDSELTLRGSSAQLPLGRREAADTATALARLVDGAGERLAAPSLDPLRTLAARHRERFAGKGGRRPQDVRWIVARRKMDLSLVEDLLSVAIRRNLAHRRTWDLLVELRKSDRLPVGHLGRFIKVLSGKTANRHPDYSCLLILRITPTIPDAAHRERIYRRLAGVYSSRPDLRGRLLIALGDDLRDRGVADKALEAYQQAARDGVELSEVVVKAARRAETLLLADNRRDLAIRMYRELFGRTKPQKIAEIFRSETSHYQLGSRLAALLTADGKKAEAKRILSRL